MTLETVTLADFRGYRALEAALPERLTVLAGRNAQGKTNFLRAVEWLGLGEAGVEEPVRHGAERALAEAWVARDGRRERLTATVSAAGGSRLALNGKACPRPRWVGRLPVLYVGPEDRDQVAGPPAARRALLDELLVQCEPAYLAARRDYLRALRQRNRALGDPAAPPESAEIWEEPLARAGGELLARRARAVAGLSPRAAGWHAELAGGEEPFAAAYRATVTAPGEEPAAWEAALRAALEAGRARDRAAGTTLSGPHRDDVELALGGRSLKGHGSAGQAWTAILALALASAEHLGARLGRLPLLLLDDVLASLDASRQARLLSVLRALPQAILTTTVRPPEQPGVTVVDVEGHCWSTAETDVVADPAAAKEEGWPTRVPAHSAAS